MGYRTDRKEIKYRDRELDKSRHRNKNLKSKGLREESMKK